MLEEEEKQNVESNKFGRKVTKKINIPELEAYKTFKKFLKTVNL